MFQKPNFWAAENAEVFKDLNVVEAYRYRPPYPVEVFDILAGLLDGEPGNPRRVLDVGCGIGSIARYLVERVEQLDAVDVSQHMLEQGKCLPNGNHPRLRWLHGRVEDVALEPPYVLVTAGESLHWMDWNIVLPRFHKLLRPGAYLAIVNNDTRPDPWSTLSEIIPQYRTIKDKFQPYNMIEELERHDLFQKVGEKTTVAVPFVQSIDDYIQSYHSRSGFSRERMGPAQAEAFDREAKQILLRTYNEGVISFRVAGSIVWGIPKGL